MHAYNISCITNERICRSLGCISISRRGSRPISAVNVTTMKVPRCGNPDHLLAELELSLSAALVNFGNDFCRQALDHEKAIFLKMECLHIRQWNCQ